MTQTEIQAILVTQLQEMEVALPEAIDENMSFMQDFKMDSLDLAEYIARMEHVFSVQVPDDEWQSLSTVGRVIDYVQARLGA